MRNRDLRRVELAWGASIVAEWAHFVALGVFAYDTGGTAITKEIVHGITSLDARRGTPEVLAQVTRGQWGIESVHWLRDTAWREDQNTGYAGNGPQVMASLRNIAVSLLHIAGVTEILRTLQAICRDRNRILDYLPLFHAFGQTCALNASDGRTRRCATTS